MIGTDTARVPAQDQSLSDLGNKSISELITKDTYINEKGEVWGTLKHVSGWNEFSDVPDEQSGNYFPISLGEKYSGKNIKVVGKKDKTAKDTEWVLRVADNNSTFKFYVVDGDDGDGEPFLTLSFKNAALEPDPVSKVLSTKPMQAVSKVPVENKSVAPDIENMTKSELLAYAEEKGIDSISSDMKKADILAEINRNFN